MNVDWWTAMRAEAFWAEEVNAIYRDFYMFWDVYHFERSEECAWKNIHTTCSDFQFA